ncbi:NUDIX domain-containing protein [Corynebacterium mendelii]|uniref:NUDIX hydrolase n=1 Tax=Corynebacterium mendelii TaxID=2765362 RepID=A0A939E0C9_9CORY|nr:bifunctional NUDIX hydrolase/histidine phosphatase family protein [Corynebacterium mendelii]MBN9644604.1 NUDIX hydrolase [Corynebacterium mendelii]
MAKKATEQTKDATSAFALTGRYQQIPPNPAQQVKRSTLAAGAVIVRDDPHGARQFAIIHRPHYDDWSLAKGKVDPGESIPVTAAREIREETGLAVRLGKLVGQVSYPVAGRTKIVYYFTATPTGGGFAANKEVDELVWLDKQQALERLSYDVDRQVLQKADKRLNLDDQKRLILVRHAHAFARRTWSGNDNKRPLDKKGIRQASLLPDMLELFGPTAVYSAEPDRCVHTAGPIAERLGVDVTVDRMLGDAGWLESMTKVKARFREILATEDTPVVVSQGLLMPEYIAWLSATGTLPLEEIRCKKAGAWILTFSRGQLAGADYLASPLPVK